MKTLCLFLSLLCLPLHAADLICASTSQADVQAKVNLAVDGDRVLVPLGTAVWSTRVTVSNKKIQLIGRGIGNTVIIDNTTGPALLVDCSLAKLTFVRGFEFVKYASHTSSFIVEFNAAQGQNSFRFSSNKFNSGASGKVLGFLRVNDGYGCVDNNQFIDIGIQSGMQHIRTFGSQDSPDGGFTPWLRPLTLGTTNAVVIEDNTFFSPNVHDEDCIDGYGGARYIIRHNFFYGKTTGFHGTDSGNRRSLFSFEIYDNKYTNNSTTSLRAITCRGGTGIAHGNIYRGTGQWNGVTLMYYRACPPLDQSRWGTCNGTVWELNSANLSSDASRTCSINGNIRFCSSDNGTIGTEGAPCALGGTYSLAFDGTNNCGYPGRDQPGRTTGQALSPVYVWNNDGQAAGIFDGHFPPVACGGLVNWLTEGRDYSNAVKVGYVDLTYPHPLRVGEGGNVPPPSGVNISRIWGVIP